ncbi:MAG: hypothetical protein AAF581_23325 [Planctomycetota bacterium]
MARTFPLVRYALIACAIAGLASCASSNDTETDQPSTGRKTVAQFVGYRDILGNDSRAAEIRRIKKILRRFDVGVSYLGESCWDIWVRDDKLNEAKLALIDAHEQIPFQGRLSVTGRGWLDP